MMMQVLKRERVTIIIIGINVIQIKEIALPQQVPQAERAQLQIIIQIEKLIKNNNKN